MLGTIIGGLFCIIVIALLVVYGAIALITSTIKRLRRYTNDGDEFGMNIRFTKKGMNKQ